MKTSLTLKRWESRLIWILLGVALLAFVNCLANPFIWDDEVVIADNPVLKSRDVGQLFTTSFYPESVDAMARYSRYRPITSLTFWIDYQLWGLNPIGFHVTNLCLHIVNALLVASIAGFLGFSGIGAFFVALFFLQNVFNQPVFKDASYVLSAPVMERLEKDGIAVDKKYLKELSREYGKGLGEIAGRIYKHAGREFNINSPKQLGIVLFDELKIVPARHKRTSTGAGAVPHPSPQPGV